MKTFISNVGNFQRFQKWNCFLLFFALTIFSHLSQAQVSGSVFKDFNANGERTPGADTLEIGVAGVKVRLFVGSSNTPVAEKLTDSKGNYAFTTAQIPADSSFKIEFANIPSFWFEGSVGKNSRTSLLFGKAPQNKFDFGISNDEDFCFGSDNAKIITSCFANGDAMGGGSAGEEPAIVMLDYKAQGLAEVDFPLTKLAMIKKVGAVWPATYQKFRKQVIVAPIVRRHSGLGPLGTSGLYGLSEDGTVDSIVNFKKRYGIDFGDDPHVGLSADMLKPNHDSATMQHVGKRAFGGLQFSRYQDSLLFINLFDKKLYIVKLGANGAMPTNKSDIKAIAIPDPGCSNSDYRPWALKYYHGMYYVGVVCSGETSQNKDDLKFTIYKYNPVSGQFTNLITEPLTYKRDPLDATGPKCFTYDRWLPWTSAWPEVCNRNAADPASNTNFVMHPQPVLSDIEFDVDGTMVLGFLDRFGLQAGSFNFGPSANDQTLYSGFMSGDLLRVHLDNGVYKLEQNAKSGDITGCGANKGAGPGGGEFYCEEQFIVGNGKGGYVGHAETANGGVTLVPGTGEVLSTAMDPLDSVYIAAGYKIFDNKTGRTRRGIALYANKPGTLGKSGGIGDVVALCEPPSIQIGNRVWFDKNRNGVQDAGEAGLDGIVVNLFDPDSNKVVGRDTTDSGGQFYFGSKNVKGGLKPLHKYKVRVDMTQAGLLNPYPGIAPVALAAQKTGLRVAADSLSTQYDLSPTNANTFADPLIRDSDAAYENGKDGLVIDFTTQNYGMNDFTQDIGLTEKIVTEPPMFDLQLKKSLIGECSRQIGQEATFKIIVSNVGDVLSVADSVFVSDTLVSNFTFVSAKATNGTFNNSTHLWGPLKLKGGESDTLTITVKINANNRFEGGTVCNLAEVKSYKGEDVDSAPGNNNRKEDDIDNACVSVPLKICPARSDTLIISAPLGFTKHQWFRTTTAGGRVQIVGATQQTLEVGAAGEYSIEVENNGCPANNCCPIYVLEDCPCPPSICVPFVIKQTKSKGKPIIK